MPLADVDRRGRETRQNASPSRRVHASHVQPCYAYERLRSLDGYAAAKKFLGGAVRGAVRGALEERRGELHGILEPHHSELGFVHVAVRGGPLERFRKRRAEKRRAENARERFRRRAARDVPRAVQPPQRRDALVDHLVSRAVLDRSMRSIDSIRIRPVLREQRKPDAAHDPAHERVLRRFPRRVWRRAAQETLRGGGEEREETHVFVRGVRQVAAQPPVLRIARLDDVPQRRRVAPAGAQRQETLAQVRRRRLAEEEGVQEKKAVRCEWGTRVREGRGGRKRAGARPEGARRVPAAVPPSRTRGARG